MLKAFHIVVSNCSDPTSPIRQSHQLLSIIITQKKFRGDAMEEI